jgi:hypothetical protein
MKTLSGNDIHATLNKIQENQEKMKSDILNAIKAKK